MTSTVALHGRVYDLGNPKRQQQAYSWVMANLGDTNKFEQEFPDAQILSSVLSTQGQSARYHFFSHASNLGNGWMASVRVVFVRANGSAGFFLRDLSELGLFTTDSAAREAASNVRVSEIRDDGTIVFAHGLK